MSHSSQIHLNFIPVQGELSFSVFRRQRLASDEARPVDNACGYKLPISREPGSDYASYWVLPKYYDGFEKFNIHERDNLDLTQWALFHGLRESSARLLPTEELMVPDNDFVKSLAIVMAKHSEGRELLEVQPYHLYATHAFGFLVDFHFRKGEGQPFSRRIQQLSMSLDRNYRRNLDYYVDRWARVKTFVRERWGIFDNLILPGNDVPVPITRAFIHLPAERLRSRVYIFANDKEAKSQFTGLRDNGPLASLEITPRLLFAFREQDRHAARQLAAALKGSKVRDRFNFPGFQSLFKSDIEIDSNPIVLADLTAISMSKALERAKLDRLTHAGVLPVIVLPDNEDNGYFEQKALFSEAEIPTQVCTLRILQDEETLKWSVANLALQIFCKAGGQPWKVKPTNERSLILGISQSHKMRDEMGSRVVEKYFAISVLTDSSGLFQKLEVLGHGTDQDEYLTDVRKTLRKMLCESAAQYSRVVIHTSFKLKHREMDAIQETVQQTANEIGTEKCRFAVIKVNHKPRFFGVNEAVNSLVPFEASFISLGRGEHLIWFEGIFPDRPTVNKAFPGPTHIKFLRLSESGSDRRFEHELLQDLVNVSGANWRGFNAKSAPVSIFYCQLVADLIHEFHARNLPLPAVKNIRPWFL